MAGICTPLLASFGDSSCVRIDEIVPPTTWAGLVREFLLLELIQSTQLAAHAYTRLRDVSANIFPSQAYTSYGITDAHPFPCRVSKAAKLRFRSEEACELLSSSSELAFWGRSAHPLIPTPAKPFLRAKMLSVLKKDAFLRSVNDIMILAGEHGCTRG